MISCNDMIIPDRITLKRGHGDLPYLDLRINGAEAHLYLHGAHVLRYQPAEQTPVLWQSEASAFALGKPIRGGIPVCWPWFGPHADDATQPAHGVARLVEWECVCSSVTPEATTATLRLPSAAYPNASLQLTVELSHQLAVTLTTTNTDAADLHFTEALHSYFAIQDIHQVTVSGLEGQRYIDQLAMDKSLQTQDGPISFTAETDRIYTNTPQTCTLIDPVLKRSIHVRKENSLSTVVWNPWVDKSIRMPDYADSEYLEMVCIETANCGPDAVTLAPGQTHVMRLQISTQTDCPEAIDSSLKRRG
ncbi:D-hexose-6-phosphate mutarotase [Planctomycetota bacterium]